MFRDYTKYDVQPNGKIWSKYSNKFLKPRTRKDGYQQVGLVDNNGKRHQELVHRVCWIAVNGREVPEGYELNHLDENKCNNHISNLQLCTHKDNMNFGTRTERAAKALKGKINHPDKSKRVGAYDKDGELVMVFPSTKEAERIGYNHGNIVSCCNGKRQTHKGYIWKYLED